MAPEVRSTRLENGLRVVTESVRDVPSVSLGVWLETGSRHEGQSTNGVCHFLEHLFFKGTEKRTPRQIAEEIEGVGGTIDAFTDKEQTCFLTRTLAEHLELSVDVLADLLVNSTFLSEDIELEREVIIHEIQDAEAIPEDYIYDFYLHSWWPGHPLGLPVAGTVASVGTISRDEILAQARKAVRSDHIVVSAAGAVDHEQLVDWCREKFAGLVPAVGESETDRPDYNPGVFVCERELDQAHLLLGFPGISVTDPRYAAAEVLIAALGGGMSSRLFQSVREERGKAYSVYAFLSPYRDIGYTGIYAATGGADIKEVLDLVFQELTAIKLQGLDPGELVRTREQIAGACLLSLESMESRMGRIARNQLYFGREIAVDEIVAEVRAVSNEQVMEIALDILSTDRAGLALVGDAGVGTVSLPLP